MAAIDFPNSPTVGQLFSVGNTTWRWDGSFWTGIGNVVPGPKGDDGGTFIATSTSDPTSADGNDGDLWIVYS